jgi:hypothetical protein
MLCEALHACGPTVDVLHADDELIEAKTFEEYVKCMLGWLAAASEEGFTCKQSVLTKAGLYR